MNPILTQKLEYREQFYGDSFLKKNFSKTKNISVVVVCHLIDTGIAYIKTLDKYYSLEYIIPKPNSINNDLLNFFPSEKIVNLKREDIQTPQFLDLIAKIPKANKFIFLDIGGYFSNISTKIKDIYGDRFIGVIEDTENGHQKYLRQDLNYPLISVARSLLKDNEDHLVGQSVVFSMEAILREQGILLNNKQIGIIGIGKIGDGIVSTLKSKSSKITIFDINPVRLVIAHAKGNNICNKLEVIQNSQIIFCATGNLSLKDDDFKYLKNGTFVASVTSSDDEMDLDWLEKNYTQEKIAQYITKYEKNGHYLYIVNSGNAINFIHGAVVDDFILLVQKEMIDTILEMSQKPLKNGVGEGFEDVKQRVADSWLKNILKINI
jgi:adenosylhomocysteinase